MLQSICCMRLKTAGIVFGCFGAVFSALAAINVCIALFHVNVSDDRDERDDTTIKMHMYLTITLSVALAFVVLQFLSSVLLILGTVKERHLMLLPWLILCGLSLVTTVIWHLYILLFSPLGHNSSILIAVCIKLTLTLALSIYMFIGIHSLYKQIKLSNKQKHLLADQPQHVNVQYSKNSNYDKMSVSDPN